MNSSLSALKDANQALLRVIAEREAALTTREKALHEELERVVNDKRALAADKEVVEKAEAIHVRMLGGTASAPEQTQAAHFTAPSPVLPKGAGQARARIGPQRYVMLATLRQASCSIDWIVSATGLDAQRVKEQMRADRLNGFVCFVGDPADQHLSLTPMGRDLLARFENYRLSKGEPLPKIGDLDDAGVEDEAKADAQDGDAEAQTNEAAGEVSVRDAPTASDQDATQGVFR